MKNDNFSLHEDPNSGGQNAGLYDLIQAQKRNLDINPDQCDGTPITEFKSSQFERLESRLVADASELNYGAGDQIKVTFPDGKTLLYYLLRTYRDGDGEIMYWEYASFHSKHKIAIFND